MNNLSFKFVVMVVILGAAFLALSPFTPDSTADDYYVIVTIYIEECWDDSRVPDSIAVLCSSTTTGITTSLMPANHAGNHGPSGVLVKLEIDKKSTFSCYVGCSSS